MADTASIDAQAIGRRIRAARKAAGYRNAESFAVALGVGHRTVTRWESGESTPSMARLSELAELTQKPVSYFFSSDGDTPKDEEAA